MPQLSLILITKNAGALIADALDSGAFADEMVVVDGGSEDDTCEIAAAHGARVVRQEWLGFGAQKRKAVTLAAHDWVFVLDADERITPELRAEILRAMENPRAAAYAAPRLNYFFGAAVKTCGLYPDYSVRMFDRRHAQFDGAPVHERVHVRGRVEKFTQPMVHLAYENIAQFIDKQNRYAQLGKKKRSVTKALLSPAWTFFKLYVLKRGFLDGWRGFVIAKLYAQYTFWKYL